MDKYGYMMQIDYVNRRYENSDIDTQLSKLMISNIIISAWNNSDINGDDMTEILERTDGIFQEIVKRIDKEEK